MSTLFNELERAAGALSCSTVAGAATYTSQVVSLQQQQHILRQSSNGSTSPTSQMSSSLSQSPLSSISSPASQQQQHQHSSTSPTTILSSSTPPLSSLAGGGGSTTTNSNLSPIGGSSSSSTVNGLVEDQRALQLAFELSMVGLSDTLAAAAAVTTNHHQHHQQQHQQHHHHHQSLQQSVLHQQLQDSGTTTSGSAHHHHHHNHQSQSPQSYADLSSVVLSNQQMLQQQQQQHLQQLQQQQQSAGTTNGLNGVLDSSTSIANGQCSLNGVSLSSVLATSQQQQHHHHQHHQQQQPPNNGCPQSLSISAAFSSILPPGIDERSKKSQNMTECVPVPSSEHVAEIVGRQGCKIKALRAKTNTYIKTPVRGEEPVFVVTGRKEDVGKAKREILSAAEHFSLIRASRKPTLSGLGGKGSPPGPPTNIPGQVTIQVRVPYRVVGLVVGPKGATIKHIQQQTHTYIVTPSRDKEPIFEVTGMPDNVQSARRQIEAHIALRTGNIAIAAAAAAATTNGNLTTTNTTSSGGSMTGLGSLLGDEANSEFLTSLYKNGFGSLLGYLEPTLNEQTLQPQTSTPLHQQRANTNVVTGAGLEHHLSNGMSAHHHHHHHNHHHHHQTQYAPVLTSSSTGGSRSCSSSSSSTSSKSAARSQPELINIWKSLGDSIDVDEGLGESPNIWTMPVTSALGSRCSPASTSVSPTDSLLGGAGGSSTSSTGGSGGGGGGGSNGSGNNNANSGGVGMLSTNVAVAAAAALCRRECLVCGDKEVTAALVPCGHNMFCMECATRVCMSNSTVNGAGSATTNGSTSQTTTTTTNGSTGTTDGICPVCSQTVLQAIRIIP